MAKATVIATIQAGTPQLGVWCEHCALPSAVEFDVLWMNESGVSVIGTYGICIECGDGR